jgi:hypothetical protein
MNHLVATVIALSSVLALAPAASADHIGSPAQPDLGSWLGAERPAELSYQMIRAAMKDVRAEARHCFMVHGLPGMAKLRINVDAEGRVASVDQDGDFVDSPTGACIAKVVTKVKFPATRKLQQRVRYPVVIGELPIGR